MIPAFLFLRISSDSILLSCENLDYFGDFQINFCSKTFLFVHEISLISGYLFGNYDKFGQNPVEDVALILLHVLLFLVFDLSNQTVQIIMQSYSHSCTSLLDKKLIGEDDIINAKEKYGIIKGNLSVISFCCILLIQSNAISGIYMTIIGENQITSALITLGFMLYLVIMMWDLLTMYDQIDKIVARARNDAYEVSTSSRDLWRMKDRADELEDYRMLTGLGFYNVDLSLVSSFLSTTLTYLIVLIQSEPLLNGSK